MVAVDIGQLFAGWSGQWGDDWGRNALDVKLHVSPGGVNCNNTSTAFSAYTGGRVGDAAYNYVTVNYARSTRLPLGFSWNALVSAEYADKSLPDTERFTIGGASAARGYSLDDGAYDLGVIVRNEIRAQSFGVLSRLGTGTPDSLSPFAFFDFGYGRDKATNGNTTPKSIGAGIDYQVAANLKLNMTGAYALTDAVVTHAYGWAGHARVTISY